MKTSTKRTRRIQILNDFLYAFGVTHLIMVCGIQPAALAGESPNVIYREAKNSTFLIETFDSKGIPLSIGTGFAVRTNYLASNCHVVRGAKRVTVKNLDSGNSFPVEAIVGSDLRADLVLLRIGASVKPLGIETNLGLSVGDSVYALGNPRGLEGTFSSGIISAVRELDTIHYIQVTAPISPGSSGGPVFSSDGKVIGVATSAIKESQNLNFAVSARHLVALLAAEQKEDTFDAFFTKQDEFDRKTESTRPANDARVVLRNFEWERSSAFSFDKASEFTFSVFNGLSRPIRNVLVVISFLNIDSEVVETKFIRIGGPIASESAFRSKGSVDASVARINNRRLYNDLVPDPPKTSKFKVGTNSVVLKWKGSSVSGYQRLPAINGRAVKDEDFLRLLKETEAMMRVARVLSFDYAD